VRGHHIFGAKPPFDWARPRPTFAPMEQFRLYPSAWLCHVCNRHFAVPSVAAHPAIGAALQLLLRRYLGPSFAIAHTGSPPFSKFSRHVYGPLLLHSEHASHLVVEPTFAGAMMTSSLALKAVNSFRRAMPCTRHSLAYALPWSPICSFRRTCLRIGPPQKRESRLEKPRSIPFFCPPFVRTRALIEALLPFPEMSASGRKLQNTAFGLKLRRHGCDALADLGW